MRPTMRAAHANDNARNRGACQFVREGLGGIQTEKPGGTDTDTEGKGVAC